MPVYMVYGFRWPRAGFTGIRVYIVLHNLEEATAEYVQQPITTQLLLESFAKTEPGIVSRLPELRFIEQYDPEDTSDAAVSKDFAYVAGRCLALGEPGAPAPGLSWSADEIASLDSGLDDEAMAALTEMRDKYAAGEKIGWWIVYNGDPERYFPQYEEDDDSVLDEDDEYMDEGEEYASEREPQTPQTPQTPTVSLSSYWLTVWLGTLLGSLHAELLRAQLLLTLIRLSCRANWPGSSPKRLPEGLLLPPLRDAMYKGVLALFCHIRKFMAFGLNSYVGRCLLDHSPITRWRRTPSAN